MTIDDLIKIDNDLTKHVAEGKIEILKGIGIDTDSFVITVSTKLVLPAEWESRFDDIPSWFLFSPLVPVGKVFVMADPQRPVKKLEWLMDYGLILNNPKGVFTITA